MKTVAYLEKLRTLQRGHLILETQALRKGLLQLEDAYGETCCKRPADTISLCFDRIGPELTKTIIATLVNYHGWDGRISNTAKRWAGTVEEAFDEQAALQLSIYTNRIHMAHLDQLACELAKH